MIQENQTAANLLSLGLAWTRQFSPGMLSFEETRQYFKMANHEVQYVLDILENVQKQQQLLLFEVIEVVMQPDVSDFQLQACTRGLFHRIELGGGVADQQSEFALQMSPYFTPQKGIQVVEISVPQFFQSFDIDYFMLLDICDEAALFRVLTSQNNPVVNIILWMLYINGQITPELKLRTARIIELNPQIDVHYSYVSYDEMFWEPSRKRPENSQAFYRSSSVFQLQTIQGAYECLEHNQMKRSATWIIEIYKEMQYLLIQVGVEDVKGIFTTDMLPEWLVQLSKHKTDPTKIFALFQAEFRLRNPYQTRLQRIDFKDTQNIKAVFPQKQPQQLPQYK